jgi:hypothetical protein
VRGPRRVVWVVDSPSSSCSLVVRGAGRDDDSELGVVLPDVSDDDVGELVGASMSVVTGGLVLVMVAVVVGVDDPALVAEKDGSTKSSGAWSGSLN